MFFFFQGSKKGAAKAGKGRAAKKEKKQKKKKDPNAPKRPMSAYFLFMNEQRAGVSIIIPNHNHHHQNYP